MNNQRTGGMTTIGVLNIVFGAIGAILFLLVVVGGGLLAAVGSGAEAEFAGTENQGVGTAVAADGGIVMLLGFIGLICSAALGVSGIGVLTLKPWGRFLSLVGGGALVVVNLISIVTGGFSIVALGLIAYGGLLFYLFMQPKWKAAFAAGATPAHGGTGTDEYRKAA